MTNPPNSRKRTAESPLQFSLRGLLLVTAGIAGACAIVSQMGSDGVLLLFVLASCGLMWIGSKDFNRYGILLVVGICGFVVSSCSLLVPTIDFPRRHSPQSYCGHNLKYIALALHNYHDTYGSLPPAYIADEQGRPIHSWRVLILPFLEQQALYDQYRFDEPWDGPNNRQLAASMPRVFRCPSDPGAKPDSPITSYLAVVGPETIWPGEKTRSWTDVKDGTTNTLLVVESHGSGIHWMEPRDLHTGQMAREINPAHGQGICGCHGSQREIAQAAFADGHVDSLPNGLPRAEVEALYTIAGGEGNPLD
jgi:prepilin-type processing-associated H-X9-DG protein